DNFVLFVDHSGSMAMTKDGAKKIDTAKTLVRAMNQVIPELGYTSALYTFAPVASYSAPAVYSTAAIDSAIGGIDSGVDIFGRRPPMGNGIIDLDSVLSGMNGKTAVIMFTDGASNTGTDPVAQAQAVYAKYGGKVCFHVVSLADTAAGQKIIDEIRAMNNCTVSADAATLLADKAALDKFVEDVFWGEKMEEAAVPESIVVRLNFDFDKYDIKDVEVPKLEQALMMMKERPGNTFVLEGWTDSVGADAYNMGLSQRRADTVKSWLVGNGMDDARLQSMGKGKSFKYDNATSDGRFQNRRVEILIK
ncbi:MAG: OmpA family protein, partial [Proteobacteria bacterium]|nr:OmpA family protein [Pseudomonadota bacterium]